MRYPHGHADPQRPDLQDSALAQDCGILLRGHSQLPDMCYGHEYDIIHAAHLLIGIMNASVPASTNPRCLEP